LEINISHVIRNSIRQDKKILVLFYLRMEADTSSETLCCWLKIRQVKQKYHVH